MKLYICGFTHKIFIFSPLIIKQFFMYLENLLFICDIQLFLVPFALDFYQGFIVI